MKEFISSIFLYFKHLYLSKKINPLKNTSILDIIKKEPWSLFSALWSYLWFLSFQKHKQCCSWGKLWFWKVKTKTLNSFCSRVTSLNQHFNYPEELFWIFTLIKKFLDLVSRMKMIFRNGYGSNFMDVMITWKAFKESQEKHQSSLSQILCNLHFWIPCTYHQLTKNVKTIFLVIFRF